MVARRGLEHQSPAGAAGRGALVRLRSMLAGSTAAHGSDRASTTTE
jgi:hypothetical protein